MAEPPPSESLTHDYYGVPIWLLKDYLVSLGAREVGENVMEAEQWRAELRKATPKHIGSLVIGGATAVFSGEPAALEAMFEKLHWKTMRGGG